MKKTGNKFNLSLHNLPREFSLLLAILEADNNNLKSVNSDLFSKIDWDLFLELTRHHRVFPLIYVKLKGMDNQTIPTHIIQTLYQEYKRNTFQMLLLTSEMETVSSLFEKNYIRALFLKGPVIAADIYGDISLRTSKDLDILIPKEDLVRTDELLLDSGYTREGTSNVLDEFKWGSLHITYFHHHKRVEIEIHQRLHPSPSKEPSFDELWGRKRVSLLTTNPVYFLGKEDLFLFLVEHGSRHGWSRLRWLVDIDHIIGKTTRFNNDLLSSPGIYQNTRIVGQAIILASLLIGSPISKEAETLVVGKYSKMKAYFAAFFIVEVGRLHTNYSKGISNRKNHRLFPINSSLRESIFLNLYIFLTRSGLQKFIFVLLLFRPSKKEVMSLKLPKILHFLYFPLRPILWYRRKVGKNV